MRFKFSHRELTAAIFSSLSAFCAGSSFVWVTPLLPRLRTPGGSDIYLSLEEASWVVSLIEIGNLFSPIPMAFLADKLGRKPVLLSIAPMYIITWILVLCTRLVPVLYTMRIVQGFALGIVFTVLPMYLGEIADQKNRGIISIFFIAMWFLGIVYVFAIGPYVSYQSLTWFCFAPPVIFLSTFWYFPETPHYLVMKGHNEKAAQSVAWLRGADPQGVDIELRDITKAAEGELEQKASWKDLFKTRQGIKSLLLVQVVAMSQIMAGFTAVLSYASETFTYSDLNLLTPDHITLVLGCTALAVTVISAGIVDLAGRRPTLIISAVGSFLTLAATASYFYILDTYPSLGLKDYCWVPYFTLILFVGVMNFGLAALLPTLQAELFPNSTRGVASGITALNICVMSFIVLKIYLPLQVKEGIYLNFVIYAMFAALGAILISVFLPETKGKSFLEIQDILSNK